MRLVASALSEPMLDKLHSLGVMPKKGSTEREWKGDEGDAWRISIPNISRLLILKETLQQIQNSSIGMKCAGSRIFF